MTVCSLFSLSVKVILEFTVVRSACMVLPPTLLHYLLYQAVHLNNAVWIQDLVRYWPVETLSFDFDKFINNKLTVGERYEQYLRQHHSWFYSPSFPLLKLQTCVINSIATGLYLRIYDSQSVEDTRISKTKQFIVDLSMVGLKIEFGTFIWLWCVCYLREGLYSHILVPCSLKATEQIFATLLKMPEHYI